MRLSELAGGGRLHSVRARCSRRVGGGVSQAAGVTGEGTGGGGCAEEQAVRALQRQARQMRRALTGARRRSATQQRATLIQSFAIAWRASSATSSAANTAWTGRLLRPATAASCTSAVLAGCLGWLCPALSANDASTLGNLLAGKRREMADPHATCYSRFTVHGAGVPQQQLPIAPKIAHACPLAGRHCTVY